LKFPNTKIIAILMFISLSTSGSAVAGPINPPKKGYIKNDQGDKCWYTQVLKENNTYFHGSLKETDGIITFDDPTCMANSGSGLGTNKMMINSAISRWYSHYGANFQTRASEMHNGSLMQKKGKCIQSKKYPSLGVTVDYFIENKSIIGLIHGNSIQGCTN